MSKEKNVFTPLEWLQLWYLAQEREADHQEHLLDRKRRLHTKLIAAQDEKFRESKLRAEKLEQKRRRQVLDKRKKIGDYYTEYIKNHLHEREFKPAFETSTPMVRLHRNVKRRNFEETGHDKEEEPCYYVTEWHAASRAKTRSPRKRKEKVEESEEVEAEQDAEEGEQGESFTIPPMTQEHLIHWDQGDVLAYSKYTNIITNKALPDHIKSILTRTFGPFLANYYINPHAPAIRIQEEPRVRLGELAANGYGARHLWRKMRNESNKALQESEMARPADIKRAFRVYVEDLRLMEYQTRREAEERLSKNSTWYLKNPDNGKAHEPSGFFDGKEMLPKRSLNLSKRLSELDEDKSSLLLFNNSAMQDSPAQIESKPSTFVTHLGILCEEDEAQSEEVNANRKVSPDRKDSEKEDASKADLSAQFKIKFLTDDESGQQGAPEFSKRYAYVPAVNPVKHVKTEASSREGKIGTSEPPARIDLSRPQGVERAPTFGDDKSLRVSRDNTFVTLTSGENAAIVNLRTAALKSRGKNATSSKNKEENAWSEVNMKKQSHRQQQQNWQPLSLPALSEYLPVGTGRVSGDGINYIKTFDINQTRN